MSKRRKVEPYSIPTKQKLGKTSRFPLGQKKEGLTILIHYGSCLKAKPIASLECALSLFPISNPFGWVPMKKPNTRCWALLWRRERDSNPRRCDPQRFSRPPHSTTLPSLLMGGKYNMIFS